MTKTITTGTVYNAVKEENGTYTTVTTLTSPTKIKNAKQWKAFLTENGVDNTLAKFEVRDETKTIEIDDKIVEKYGKVIKINGVEVDENGNAVVKAENETAE